MKWGGVSEDIYRRVGWKEFVRRVRWDSKS